MRYRRALFELLHNFGLAAVPLESRMHHTISCVRWLAARGRDDDETTLNSINQSMLWSDYKHYVLEISFSFAFIDEFSHELNFSGQACCVENKCRNEKYRRMTRTTSTTFFFKNKISDLSFINEIHDS